MDHDKELQFLIRVLDGLNISTHMWPGDSDEISSFDLGMRLYVDPSQDYGSYIEEYAGRTEERTLYTLRDSFGFSYLLFMEPGNGELFLLIGPYFTERPSKKLMLRTAERFKVDPSRLDGFLSIYYEVPEVHDGDMLISIVSSYLSLIWGESGYRLGEMEISGSPDFSPHSDNGTEIVDRTEKTYRAENELMAAVRAGDTMRVREMLKRFSFGGIPSRTADPVRNMKNHAVIMNTLLRKAAESGNVHPVYLDRLSGAFARAIEGSRTAEGVEQILLVMPEKYADLVRKEGLEGKSRLIRKALMITAENISRPLTLSFIASALGVSDAYLSRLWKKECGVTPTEYIRKEKMKSAEQLLTYTDLRIETVAELTGYPDICYFSRVYRKVMGECPTDTRRSGRSRMI